MSHHKHRFSPLCLESLDDRVLMTAGVTASLSRGVLSIVGTSADAAITVDVMATRTRRGVSGVVDVDGVGEFRAAQVRQVVIKAVAGETVDINRGPKWNPVFRVKLVNPPVSVSPVVTTSVPNPTVTTGLPTLKVITGQPISSPTSTSTATESSAELEIVNAVNLVRQQNGLAPLQVNAQLVQAAQLQAGNMAKFNIMSHVIPQAAQPELTDRARLVGYNYAQIGENIAFNYSDTTSVMTGWMNSSGHRANILGANYTQIGVGIAYDSSGQPYYCQVFGKPMG